MSIHRVGQKLGNYRLIGLLGRGSYADVYLGVHEYLKTEAAIKVLHAQLIGAERDKFIKEAERTAKLRHSNIVSVLEFGIQEDAQTNLEVPYLVMQYAAEGTILRHHPRGELLTLQQVAPYVRQIAEALDHAHSKGIVHLDVKPENILVEQDGKLLLSDFGIAFVAHEVNTQHAQAIVGTIAYMAPEQIQGHPVEASDQYALGILVYEWLCGSRPFTGGIPEEIMRKHVHVPPTPLSERIAIPRGVEDAVMVVLRKEPEERFRTVGAFARALELANQELALPITKKAEWREVSPSEPTVPDRQSGEQVFLNSVQQFSLPDPFLPGVYQPIPLPVRPGDPSPKQKPLLGILNKSRELLDYDWRFFKEEKGSIFRTLGFICNVLSACLLGFLLHDWGAVIWSMPLSLVLFYFCILMRRKLITIPLAIALASYWAFVGFTLDTQLKMIDNWPWLPFAEEAAEGFFIASLSLHLWYLLFRKSS